MVEPLEAAAVADDLNLLDSIDQHPPRKPCNTPEIAAENPNTILFEDLLVDSIIPVLPPSPAKNSPPSDELNEDELEELEWLSNKEAFPSLETSFEIITDASLVSVLLPQFRVPTKARSEIRRKRRRILPPIPAAAGEPPEGNERRRCWHCEVEDMPQWRMWPEGPKTLCNACGVRYKKGRLFPEYRPANSPTFLAGVHSNSTRRIMEMRLGTRRRQPGKRGRPRLSFL